MVPDVGRVGRRCNRRIRLPAKAEERRRLSAPPRKLASHNLGASVRGDIRKVEYAPIAAFPQPLGQGFDAAPRILGRGAAAIAVQLRLPERTGTSCPNHGQRSYVWHHCPVRRRFDRTCDLSS